MKRVVSGMRPTGKLHLGHLVGALNNWADLQQQYDCFYFVADWHALTSGYADTSDVVSNTYDMVADWIAGGLDPEKSTFFVQSLVPEHAELFLLLSMVIPTPWLERVPTYKEQQEQFGMFRHQRLNEQRAALRVQSSGDPVGDHVVGALDDA